MSTPLQQETLGFLRRFQGRRRALLMFRAACVLAAVALGVLIGLALVDSQWLVPDQVRWGISFVAYVLAGIAAWVTALRLLFGIRGQRELAQVIEKTDPSLGEELVSAVELADPTGEQAARYDSEAFRGRVQADVADRVRRLDLSSMLPVKRISKSIIAALIAIGCLVGLLLIPGLQFSSFFKRAALPLMNLARPSEIGIHIMEPAPADRSVPEFETVPLLVETDGPPVDAVTLEIVDEKNGRSKVEMRRERNGRFAAEIPMERANISYRVRANNSITRYFELTPRERPKVTAFSKTYRYPAYTALPERVVEESAGDVSAIEGTSVRLRLDTNGPIDQAELRLESANSDVENLAIPMRVNESGQLEGDLPVMPEFTTYRVHLVAQPDDVTNKFSPLYEIRSVIDQSPVVQMTEPYESRELFTDDVLLIAGNAEDDFGVERMAYAYRVDGLEWREVDIPLEAAAELDAAAKIDAVAKRQEIRGKFDLAAADLFGSELLVLKLIAVDGKGNVGESAPLRFALEQRSSDLVNDSSRRSWNRQKAALAKRAAETARKIRETERMASRARNAIRKTPDKRNAQEQLDVIELADAAAENKRMAEELREDFKGAVRRAPNRTQEEELMAAARVASYVERELLEPLTAQLRRAAKIEPPSKLEREPANRANEAAWQMEKTARALQAIAAAEKAMEVAEQAEKLQQRQQQVAEDSRKRQKEKDRSPDSEQALQDRKEFNELAAGQLRDELMELAEVAPNGSNQKASHLARLMDHHERERNQREDAQLAQLQKEQSPEKAADKSAENTAKNAETMKRQIDQASRETQNLAKTLNQQAAREREQLLRENVRVTPDLERIKQAAEQVAHHRERDEKKQLNKQDQERLAQFEQDVKDKLDSAADQLRDNAELEEQREQADFRAAADQSLLARVLEGMKPDASGGSDESKESATEARQRAKDLAAAEEARKAIEADDQARDLAAVLEEAAREERKGDAETARRDQPDAWQEANERIKKLPEALRQANLDKEAIAAADKLKNNPAARKLTEEMKRRDREQRQDDKKINDVARQFAELSEAAEKQKDVADAQAQAARERLAELAPSIPERAEGLADQLADQSKENQQAADNATDREATPKENSVAAEEGAAKNTESNERLEELLDDLRREANARNLRDAEQRELARDADDALAEMHDQEAGERAQQALEIAAESEQDPELQAAELDAAAREQKALSETLDKIAKQMKDPNKGRQALRESEQESESGDEIAANFDRAEELAEMLDQATGDQKSTEATLSELEEELRRNPAMQEALADIAEDAAAEAAEAIRKAAQRENALADETGKQAKQSQDANGKQPNAEQNAKAAREQNQIKDQVDQAAQDLARAARHQDRLENSEARQAIEEVARAATEAAEGEVQEAAESLSEQKPIAESAKQVGEAKDQLDKLTEQAKAAAAAEKAASEAAEKAAAQNASNSQQSPESENQDQNQNPGQPQSGQPQNGQPSQGSPSEGQGNQPGNQPSKSGQPGEQSPGSQPSDSPAEQAQARALAEALDQLDKSMAAQQSNQASSEASEAQTSLAEALNAQAQSMADSRAQQANQSQGDMTEGQPGQPGEPSSQPSSTIASGQPDAGNDGDAKAFGELGRLEAGEDLRDWGKLPPQVAKEILESRRDGVAPEYREAIESYYRALGERARSDR